MDSNKDKFFALVILIVLLVLAFSTSQAAEQKDGLLKVYFLDVGQGDAIFIEAPNGNQVLVDGGPDSKVISELSRVVPFYDQSIDVVVVSHPHSDHIGGLDDVLNQYDISYVVQAGEEYDSGEFRTWQKSVAVEGATTIDAVAGTRIDLGSETTLTILHPLKSAAGTITKTPHEDVVVAMLSYRNIKILLTGDMEADVEKILLGKNVDVDADVLKIGHHGSKTSTSDQFLNMVSPQAAVIQVGAKNRYKHPTQVVLSRLENSSIKQYRNDIDGMIRLTSDGSTFAVSVTN